MLLSLGRKSIVHLEIDMNVWIDILFFFLMENNIHFSHISIFCTYFIYSLSFLPLANIILFINNTVFQPHGFIIDLHIQCHPCLFFKSLDYFWQFALPSLKDFDQNSRPIFGEFLFPIIQTFPVYKHGLDLGLPKCIQVLIYNFLQIL